MRPISLTMTAFGPFAATERIAFDSLGSNPLFLINGPTGSGKTTILDAICFALYGKTTGDERQPAQMRCDQAASDSVARVELLFEINHQRYRVIREPEQLRPKLRGEGFTRHSARAELYRVDNDAAESLMVAAKVTEATAAIEAMTGLSVEQFRQVMVLPQGEFRRLLLADSADREKIFSQLFQTHIYKRIEYALKDQSAGLRNEMEALQNQQKGILASADVLHEEQLNELLQLQKPLVTKALNAKLAALSDYQAINIAVKSAQKLLADFDRLAKQQQQLQTLIEQGDAISRERQQLAKASHAQKIFPHQQKLQLAEQACKQAEIQLERCRAEYAHSDKSLIVFLADLQQAKAREPEIDQLRDQQSRLNSYRDRVITMDKAREQLEKSRNSTAAILEKRQQQAEKLADIETRLLTEKKHEQDSALLIKTLTAEQLELSLVQQQLLKRRELDQTELQLSQYQQQLLILNKNLQDATEQLDDKIRAEQHLDLIWHRAQAALLARQLETGKPCLVCGSEQHPDPAVAEIDIPDEQQRISAKQSIELARQSQQSIINDKSRLETSQQHANKTVSLLSTQLGAQASTPVEKLQLQCDELVGRQTTLQALQLAEKQQSETIKRYAYQQTQYAQELADLDKSLVSANTEQQLAEHTLDTAEAEIPEEFRQQGALLVAIKACGNRLDALRLEQDAARKNADQATLLREKTLANLGHAEHTLQQLMQALLEASNVWQQSLGSSGFADQQAYQIALLSEDQIHELQQSVQEYDRMLATCQGAVTTLQQALADSRQPDIKHLSAQLEAAQLQLTGAERHHADVDKRYSQLLQVQKKLQQVKQEAQSLEDQYAIVGTLSDVANGRTDNRISLQRFVLSVLLDDVLIDASQRLKSMSKGRYELYRQQSRTKGSGASGLELLVEDAYTGKQRPVATLSGGESFMAALSLALGLSDVVQAYAGGIKLDTLFIDEGFGSLDPESLDLAINTLIDLQASGRMVGIISHVPDLKERIHARLDVHSDRSGSHTQVVLA